MSTEHEAKFVLQDIHAIRERLAVQAVQRRPWHLETNVIFDRNGELLRTGRLLRLRITDATTTLTFKGPATTTPAGVKSREEQECQVDNSQSLEAILIRLGYAPFSRYEKFRTVWTLGQGAICLDLLPFGHFLEIEASPADIPRLARDLGLDPDLALSDSYFALHDRRRAALGLTPNHDILFDPVEKNRLATLLGCHIPI